jgi:hypothetical protein
VKDTGSANDAQVHTIHTGSNIGPNFTFLNGGHGHHWSSGEPSKHDTASQHEAHDFEPSTGHVAFASAAARTHGPGDSFHFKDKISVPDVSDAAEVDHAPWAIGHRESTARTSEPLAISEAAQAIEMASPGHHAFDNSKHHWFSNISNGPDHAWSGASTHAPHDLIV